MSCLLLLLVLLVATTGANAKRVIRAAPESKKTGCSSVAPTGATDDNVVNQHYAQVAAFHPSSSYSPYHACLLVGTTEKMDGCNSACV